MPDIRAEISSFSQQSENVLLLLLRENEDLKSMLKGRVCFWTELLHCSCYSKNFPFEH